MRTSDFADREDLGTKFVSFRTGLGLEQQVIKNIDASVHAGEEASCGDMKIISTPCPADWQPQHSLLAQRAQKYQQRNIFLSYSELKVCLNQIKGDEEEGVVFNVEVYLRLLEKGLPTL